MARSSSASKSTRGGGGAWKYVGAAAVAIVGGVGIGYLFGGARAPRAPEQPVPPSATVLTPPATPGVSPSSIRPQTTNGNYTAPNAPRITIREEQTPTMRRVTPPSTPVDSEASQEAVPTPRRPAADTAASTGDTPAPLDSNPSTTPPAVNAAPAAPDTSKTATPDSGKPASRTAPKPPANADPDIEQVTPRGTPSPSPTPDSATHAQFRVQTGAYADEGNARSVADQLRSQGYSTSTRSERDGDHLVYKVQVGAYRSHSGASKAADDLQKKGVPVYVTPIGP